jgi:hypothetical protein
MESREPMMKSALPGVHRSLDGVMNGLALVLPISIALSNVMWGMALLLGLVLWGVERPRFRWTGIEWPWLLGLGIGVLTAVVSADPSHGIRSLRSEILVVVFLVCAHTGDGPALRKRLVFFAVGVAVAAGMGLLQKGLSFVWDPSMGVGALPEWLGFFPSKVGRLLFPRSGRAMGFYSHPISFAEMLLAAGFMALGVGLVVDRRRLWWVVGGLVGGAILFSQTRSVWLAVFLTLFLWILIRRDRRVLSLTLSLSVVFVLALTLSPSLRGRAVSIVDTKSNVSNLIRLGLWEKSLQLIREHPFVGVGGGNFRVKGEDLRWGGSSVGKEWTETHSMYLQVAVERGLPGLGVFLWFLTAVGWLLWKAARSNPLVWGVFFSFVGLLLAGLTETWINDSEVVMCFYFLVGTAWALGKTDQSKSVKL